MVKIQLICAELHTKSSYQAQSSKRDENICIQKQRQ